MPFPNFEKKHDEAPLFTPDDYVAYVKKIGKYPQLEPPTGLIICYQSGLLEYILENHNTTKVRAFGEMYLLDETAGKVAVAGKFGIGAPAVIATLEDKIAFGINNFISIGVAGSLQKDIKIGDLVVCDKAIRDEGTSFHYLEPSKYAYASEQMTEKIKHSLDKMGKTFVTGTSWTTDAVYRETIAEIKHYQEEGVATVEMEASALFAVAQYRNVQMGAILTISDNLAELEWKPGFHMEETKEGLETLYKVALDVLLDGRDR